MRKHLLIGVLVALVGAVVTPASASQRREVGCQQATVLLIHGGGFLERNPLAVPTQPLRRLGYRVAIARYPLGDVRGAYRAVADQASKLRGRGPLVAIGESAGGSIATWLAGHRHVDGAIAIGAPQDFRSWGNPSWGRRVRLPTVALRTRYSPVWAYRRQSGDAALLAFHYRGDIFVAPDQTDELRNRGASVVLLDGWGHIEPRWLKERAVRFLRHATTG